MSRLFLKVDGGQNAYPGSQHGAPEPLEVPQEMTALGASCVLERTLGGLLRGSWTGLLAKP